MKLSPAQQAQLTNAVATAESHTRAEVVLVILPRSRAYLGVPALVAVLLAYTGLAWILFSDDIEVDPIHVLPTLALLGGVAFALASWLPPQWTSTARQRRAAVDNMAHASFSRHGVYRTTGRTGILVFLSTAEQQARLLFDRAVADGVPQDMRDGWKAAFTAQAAHLDVASLSSAIVALGQQVGAYLPRSADDVDELPNAPRGEEEAP